MISDQATDLLQNWWGVKNQTDWESFCVGNDYANPSPFSHISMRINNVKSHPYVPTTGTHIFNWFKTVLGLGASFAQYLISRASYLVIRKVIGAY